MSTSNRPEGADRPQGEVGYDGSCHQPLEEKTMAARRTQKSEQAPAMPKYLGVFVTQNYPGQRRRGEDELHPRRSGVPPSQGVRLQHRDHRRHLGQRTTRRPAPASATNRNQHTDLTTFLSFWQQRRLLERLLWQWVLRRGDEASRRLGAAGAAGAGHGPRWLRTDPERRHDRSLRGGFGGMGKFEDRCRWSTLLGR